MSTFCEFGHHDAPSIRESSGKLIHSIKACTECTPAYLAKNLTVKEGEGADSNPSQSDET